jgi:hypothetical protein
MPLPFDIDPAIWAAIITGALTFIITLLVAFYGPRFSERAKTNKLKNGLYRELVNWYELVRWHIKYFDLRSEERLFVQRPYPDNPAELSKLPDVGYSIKQSEEGPLVGRPGRRDLQYKIEKLREVFDRLTKEMRATSLYLQTLGNEESLQRLYHIRESFQISNLYEDFRYAFDYKFEPYVYVPKSQFLTKAEAKELALLEAQLDWLRLACGSFDEAEKRSEIDACLLDRLRRSKPRGTLVTATGVPPATARWCANCEKYSEPVKHNYVRWLMAFSVTHDFYFRFLRETSSSKKARRAVFLKILKEFCKHNVGHFLILREHCKYCGRKLPTVAELTAQLVLLHSPELERCAETLSKTYEYNMVEFRKDAHIRPLLSALEDPDSSIAVRTAIMNAIKFIIRHGLLEKSCETEVKRITELMTRALEDLVEGASVRQTAIEVIGALYKNKQTDAVSAPLLWTLNGIDDQVRITAAQAVRFIGDEKLIPDVHNSLRYTTEPSVQEEIVRALGRLGRRAIPCLQKVLDDESLATGARIKAARSLGNMGRIDQVWQPLRDKMEEAAGDHHLQEGIEEALTWLKPQYREYVGIK